jgi:hypothetical protein
VGDSSSGSGAEERIENQISGLGSNVKNSLKKAFWLRSGKHGIAIESHNFSLRILIVPDV